MIKASSFKGLAFAPLSEEAFSRKAVPMHAWKGGVRASRDVAQRVEDVKDTTGKALITLCRHLKKVLSEEDKLLVR